MGAASPYGKSGVGRVSGGVSSIAKHHLISKKRSMGKRRVSMLSISRIFGMNTEPGVIVTKSPGIDERLIVIRRTAFILYIPDDLLRDFAACFMTVRKSLFP